MSLSVLNPLHFPSTSFPRSENCWLCKFQHDKAVLFSYVDLYSNTFSLRDDSSWLHGSKTQDILGRTYTAQPSAAFLCAFPPQKIFWFIVSCYFNSCLNLQDQLSVCRDKQMTRCLMIPFLFTLILKFWLHSLLCDLSVCMRLIHCSSQRGPNKAHTVQHESSNKFEGKEWKVITEIIKWKANHF